MRYTTKFIAVFSLLGALVTPLSITSARPVAAATYPRCYAPVTWTDGATNRAVHEDSNAVLYADGARTNFELCQESPGTFALRMDRPGADWCGIAGSLSAAWLRCSAGGPGKAELFEVHCVFVKGRATGWSHIGYKYGEESWGRSYVNWIASAPASYYHIMSTSPAQVDSMHISHLCN